MNRRTILLINPGSTSTKIATSDGTVILTSATFRHPTEELKRFLTLWDQYPMRLSLCRSWAGEQGSSYAAIGAMGGLLKPLSGGTYRVNEAMVRDARANLQGEHASNLGCAIAAELAMELKCPAYVVDPVSVDEFQPLAYYSGHPRIKRNSLSHALNIHFIARRACTDQKLQFDSASVIVAHLGGGISVAPVRGGRIIDVNDASSDGPFSPERTGGLPLSPLVSLCFTPEMTERAIRKMIMGEGGLVAYLGTNSADEVERRIREGDSTAKEVLEAMAYQIAKEIGAMATVLEGRVDLIALTGGLAGSASLVPMIERRVKYIAPVVIYPGDEEMRALSGGVARVLDGIEQEKEY